MWHSLGADLYASLRMFRRAALRSVALSCLLGIALFFAPMAASTLEHYLTLRADMPTRTNDSRILFTVSNVDEMPVQPPRPYTSSFSQRAVALHDALY